MKRKLGHHKFILGELNISEVIPWSQVNWCVEPYWCDKIRNLEDFDFVKGTFK